MKKIGLSLIIPVYNSAEWIGPTLTHIFKALDGTRFDVEIIIVDDGSTDDSVAAVKVIKSPKKVKLTIIEQQNSGRYLARKRGVEAARYEHILFIDSRVYIDEGSLRYLERELKTTSDQIWNGHVNIDKRGNIFARFWDAIVVIAWRKYFKKPTRTSYGIDSFDHYPKGTGFFFVPKKRLQDAMVFFEQSTNDLRHSSDDTLLIRYLAERQDINLSPEFSCLYHGRSTFKQFIKHAYSRGQFFIDGFLRKGTRFFYPLLAVLATSLIGIILLLAFAPVSLIFLIVVAVLFSVLLTVGALILGVTPKDSLSLGILSVPFAIVYLLGLWRGIFRKLRNQGVKGIALNAKRGLIRKRSVLRGSILEYIFAAFAYLVFAAIVTKYVILNIGDQIYASIGDATAGFMWLNYAEPGLDLLPTYTDDVNYPVGEAVGGPTFITYMAIWIPIRIASYLFGPIAGLNIVMYLGFVLSAMAAYWLIKRITGNVLIAFFAGIATAFTPYALYKSSGHIAYIFSGVFIFILASFVALIKKPTLLRAILFAATVALAFYTDGYYILLAATMVIGLLFAAFVFGLVFKFSLRDHLTRLKYLLVSFFSLLLFLVPVALTQIYQGAEVAERLNGARSDIRSEIVAYRSNVVDFMLPSEYHPVFGENEQLQALHGFKSLRSNKSESMNYLGYTLVFLAAVGAVIVFTRLVLKKYSSFNIDQNQLHTITFIFIAAATTIPLFLAFMFSPEVYVAGVRIPLPGQLFIDYDVNLWRVMSRFFVPLHAVLAIVASLGLYILYKVITPTSRSSIRRRIMGTLLIVVFTATLIFEFAADMPNRPYSFSRDMPESYAWLAKQKDIKVVAELPFVDPLDERTAGYVSSQIIHGKKIVNMKDPNDARLSNILGNDMNEETLNFMYERGVDAVVVRSQLCPYETWGVLIHSSNLESKAEPKMCIYRLGTVDKDMIDDAFIVYGEGFNPSPNAKDQTIVVLNSANAKFGVKRADLISTLDDIRDGVKVSGKLKNNRADKVGWSITDESGAVVESGIIGSGKMVIFDFISTYEKLELKIQVNNYRLGELTLSDVTATDL